MALQVRRGTNAERLQITPAEGELIYTIDTKQLYVGDGITAGGNASIAGTIDSLLADSTPQLGGTLDLNNNDITGTGNINITGTINATGNINLGDGAGGDIITLGGDIAGDLVPDTSDTRNIGSQTRQWNEAWIGQLNVNSQVSAERFEGDLIARDSTLVFNSQTGALAAEQLTGTATITVVGNVTGNVVGNTTGYHTGDVSGSVFADDSTLIVDGISSAITASTLNTQTINNTGAEIAFKKEANVSIANFTRVNPAAHTASDSIGRFRFSTIDSTTNTSKFHASLTQTGENLLYLPSFDGTLQYDDYFKVHHSGKVAINTGQAQLVAEPTATLDVGGNIKINGAHELLLGNMTTVERDALTAANGMIVYNTTDNKFQGYENGSWVNLI